jgi:DNA polymerase III epsilon subunit-like protein
MDIQSMALMANAQGRISLPLNPKNGQPLVKVDALLEAFNLSRGGDHHGALEDVRLEEQVLLKLANL